VKRMLTGTATDPRIAVPELVGRPQAEAAARLDALGLHVGQVQHQSDPSIPADAVVACTPRPGTRVEPGSAVDLVVSTGPERVAVPPVVGAPEATARDLLKQRNLVVGEITRPTSETVAKGVVIASLPAPGEFVVPGSRVDLQISSGPAPVPVPNVVGKTLAEATASISEKLTVGQTTTAPSAQYPEGSVISSNPPAGKEVAPGSPVDLVVSGGPPMPTVTDLGVGQAAEVLQTAKLLDRSTFVDANGRPADSGTVVKSDPAAGEAVSKNQQITLTVRPRGSG